MPTPAIPPYYLPLLHGLLEVSREVFHARLPQTFSLGVVPKVVVEALCKAFGTPSLLPRLLGERPVIARLASVFTFQHEEFVRVVVSQEDVRRCTRDAALPSTQIDKAAKMARRAAEWWLAAESVLTRFHLIVGPEEIESGKLDESQARAAEEIKLIRTGMKAGREVGFDGIVTSRATTATKPPALLPPARQNLPPAPPPPKKEAPPPAPKKRPETPAPAILASLPPTEIPKAAAPPAAVAQKPPEIQETAAPLYAPPRAERGQAGETKIMGHLTKRLIDDHLVFQKWKNNGGPIPFGCTIGILYRYGENRWAAHRRLVSLQKQGLLHVQGKPGHRVVSAHLPEHIRFLNRVQDTELLRNTPPLTPENTRALQEAEQFEEHYKDMESRLRHIERNRDLRLVRTGETPENPEDAQRLSHLQARRRTLHEKLERIAIELAEVRAQIDRICTPSKSKQTKD